MESQPGNPEYRNNPENFYPCNGTRSLCITHNFTSKKYYHIMQTKMVSLRTLREENFYSNILSKTE